MLIIISLIKHSGLIEGFKLETQSVISYLYALVGQNSASGQ